MFLRNAWYVAMRSAELRQEMARVTLLGEDIVLYRRRDGQAVALENACPHRKLPLSAGTLVEDRIVCGYHGLTFEASGACVAAPTQGRIPPSARVHSYPVAERWGMVWLWMGALEQADEDLIVDIAHHDDDSWNLTGGGPMDCACNYLYLTDNLLDPSHVAWVHKTSFAASGTQDTPLDIKATPHGVVVTRWIYDQEPPPFYAPLLRFQGRCDRLQYYEVLYPSIAINRSVFAPAGTGGPDTPLHPDAYVMESYHLLTPQDETHTRYYWIQNFNTPRSDEEIRPRVAANAAAAFEEDRLILEAVQRGMDNKRTKNIDLALDAAAYRFRRGLVKLIEREEERGLAEPG